MGIEKGQETLPLNSRRGKPRAQTLLLLFHRDGSQTVPLYEGVPVRVGRAAPADVVVEDEQLSRQHAEFVLNGDVVHVRDLGSTNGTWYNGEKQSSVVLRPGDEVVLGSVSASLHVSAGGRVLPTGLIGHDAFSSRLEEEVRRSRFFGRGAAMMMLRSQDGEGVPVGRWCPAVQEQLRPVDVIAMYSAGTAEVLLPELNAPEVATLAVHLAKTHGLCVGIAAYPDSGTSADELLEVCRTSLSSTSSSAPVGSTTEEQRVRRATPSTSTEGPVAASPKMRALFETIERVAASDIPVLLHGETGAGKEVIARSIHDASGRAKGPLIFVNCGAIPSQLLESTLFGHMKGAFTGALKDQKGVFEAGHGGTVMLDELGELPAAAQAALLRVLESKKIVRIGATEEVAVDVRVVAATHRDLEAMCEQQQFRWDLLYRLNAMTLTIPPLRERVEDVDALAQRFLAEACARANRPRLELDPDAEEALRRHQWPGNVRELKNAMERAVVIAPGQHVRLEDLPDRIRQAAERGVPQQMPADAERISTPPVDSSAGLDDLPFKERIQRVERDLIVQALDKEQGSQTAAARLLNMPLRTLIHKMKTYGVQRGNYS